MRRWELVTSGSAKFWEIGQDGAEVTVRFGRLGTAGQTQTKELASVEAAQAHVAKVVAEKEKKGYRESATATPASATASLANQPTIASPANQPTVASPTATSPSSPTEPATLDEDTWVMPRPWLRDVVRQRGYTPAPEFTLDPTQAAQARQHLADQSEAIERALSAKNAKPDLVAAAREHLAGQPNPVGAAAIAAITTYSPSMIHAWIEDHGLVFAVTATVELMGLAYLDQWDERRGRWTGIVLQHRRDRYDSEPDKPDAQMLTAARYALASAQDEERQEVEAALDALRATAMVKEARSYLVPARADWFTQACKQQWTQSRSWMLPCSASDIKAYEKQDQPLTGSAAVMYTAAYVLGPAIAPLLAEELDEGYGTSDRRKQAYKVLAALPTDEAFTILLDRLDRKYARPALQAAMAAFPTRAVRLMTERIQGSDEVRQLLTAHLLANPSLTASAEVTAMVAESEAKTLPEASADQLPPLLASPPWHHRKPQAKPVVLNDVPAPQASLQWLPGEEEEWLKAFSYDWYLKSHNWKKLLEQYQAGTLGYNDNDLFLIAPADEVRHLLADWQPNWTSDAEDWGRKIAAKFGIDAVPALVRLAQASPATNGLLLLPFATVEVAGVMAGWFARSKQAKRWAVEWLDRHRDLAVRLLIPAATGKAGTARSNAEVTLRHLRGMGVDVPAVAEDCGARAAIDVVLSVDPVDVLPARLPVIGDWADPRLLPQVLLEGREHALSAQATRDLLMMAALSKPDDVYAGLPIVRQKFDPISLAEFAWAVFQAWDQAGAPSKENWALSALGWFGDDSTVRALSPLIRDWPGEGLHARAVAGLDVLAEIGTEIALSHLNTIAEKVSFKGLKTKAQEKVTQIATALGLSRDQLSDRLVPRLGLDDAATLVIDYGSRQFTVGFDEQLKPFVIDPDGKRRKDLPKPGAKDDEDLAPREHKRFTTLKKDVRTIASDQIKRLERAMVDQRTWAIDEFLTVLVPHPLLWHLVRRLVWITDENVAFRLAEDRTPAGVEDDELTFAEGTTVRVAHAAELGDSLETWSETLADYEILQPFPQLGRPVHQLGSGEDLLGRLKKYCDTPYPFGKILGLTKRSWVRGTPQDAGVECWMTRPVPDGGALVVRLDPGIAVGVVDEFPEISLTDVWFSPSGKGEWSAPKDAPTTIALDPVTISELLSELESLHS
ncbi:DUF4132 domain-containing protein [Lentzea sp. NPDC051838]|uniref:DUF4132 domain-containing protein n=1 Tax=Lentzea sp. NPDC051838 TaxID=3154849 RepID=UPI00343C30DF